MTSSEEVTLKNHFESQLADFKELFKDRIVALEKATILASATLERRLEGMNEFRATLKDQAAQFITRKEVEALLIKINDDLSSLRETRAEMAGKASVNQANISSLLAIISILISMLAGAISLFRLIR